jgi:hypothetical protein
MPVPEQLVKIVACPKCKGPLEYSEKQDWFDCKACKLRYLVVDQIPDFIIENAQEIKDDD